VSAFVQQRNADFGVEPICRTLGVSASAYYQRANGPRSRRAARDEWLLEEIRRVHRENYERYGSRRVWKALLREGIDVARCTVERLMSSNGIQGAKRRGRPWRTTTPDPAAKHAPDLVERDFTAERPNELWVADFTYLRTWDGAVFFAFVIDVFSRIVVGWQLETHMSDTLVLDALGMALGLRAPGADVALVHHSDRGSSKWDIGSRTCLYIALPLRPHRREETCLGIIPDGQRGSRLVAGPRVGACTVRGRLPSVDHRSVVRRHYEHRSRGDT
jgi:transposase InsO family protein